MPGKEIAADYWNGNLAGALAKPFKATGPPQ
jgi:hypothetical protein